MVAILATLWKTTRFASDAAGLEKALRLLQAVVQIIAFYLPAQDAVPWLQARQQFALGRRYLRFFKFTDAFTLAHMHFLGAPSSVKSILETGKYSCLGMYLLLESCTILDAMGVRSSQWASWVLVEANRFWFYSLCLSLVLASLQLTQLFTETSTPEAEEKVLRSGKAVKAVKFDEKDKVKMMERALRRQIIVRKALTDACDILIPGSVVRWMPVGPVLVGMSTVVSTVLASGDVWDRVQGVP